MIAVAAAGRARVYTLARALVRKALLDERVTGEAEYPFGYLIPLDL